MNMMMENHGGLDSDHSSHASSNSPVIAIKPPTSPLMNNNNNNNHHHSMASNHNQVLSPRQASPLGPGCPLPPGMSMSAGHPLSPPPVSTANLVRSMGLGHLHPPGLGLLNSLGVLHNPLDLMAHHGPPRSYNSPPPISTSDPTANECKLVDYRGQKVAAFIIAGDTMLCLPQAFELFLKHLVGGLHTVYTKLKRLDIVPLVCNVEQVRILRGLGAIQPGVNRCKLLSCKDFDTLYRDCTTASSRPGRPPKRAPVGLSLAASHLQHQQMKKHRMDNGDYPYENGHMDMGRLEKSPLLANGYNHPPHLGHMQFMQLPHPAAAHSALLSPAMPHNLARPDGSVIKNQGMPTMEAIARSGIWENCRAAYEDIVKHLERLREERGDPERPLPLDQKVRDLSPRQGSPHHDHSPVLNLSKSGGGSAGSMGDDHSGSEADVHEEAPPTPRSLRSPAEDDDDDNISDDPDDEDEKDHDMDDSDLPLTHQTGPGSTDSQHAALNYSTLASAVAASAAAAAAAHHQQQPPNTTSTAPTSNQQTSSSSTSHQPQSHQPSNGLAPHHHAAAAAAAAAAASIQTPSAMDSSAASDGGTDVVENQLSGAVISSTETLLRNIQGLLKVAADNARLQERQINYEKAELKMDLLRERDLKNNFEKQLYDEQKLRGLFQKRLRKERRARRNIQVKMDLELKRIMQLEEALKHSGGAEQLKLINDSISEAELQLTIRQKPRQLAQNLPPPNTAPQQNLDNNQQRSTTPTNQLTSSTTQQMPCASSSGHIGPTVTFRADLMPTKEQLPESVPTADQTQQLASGAMGVTNSGDGKPWGYTGLDLINSSAAFWQNYSDSLAQEFDMERKNRQQQSERDVKSPLQDRTGYYKNSVLFTSSAT